MTNRVVTWLWGHLPLTAKIRRALVWLLSPKYTVGVIGLVQDEQGRILLLRHTYRGSKPWGLPGGGLKAGESLEECLRREIREETEVEVVIETMLSASTRKGRRRVELIFSCALAPGEDLSKFEPNAEIAEARFFSPDRLPPDIAESQRRLIEVALRQAAGDRRL